VRRTGAKILSKATRILVVDDHSVVRRGVRAMLANNRRWKVCGEAASGNESVVKARALHPDAIVMDITMNDENGLEATRRILRSVAQAKILILTMHESEQVVSEVLKAGAHGYVLKSDADHDLVAGIEALAQGRTFFTTKVARMVVDGYIHSTAHNSGDNVLSARQREVRRLLAFGKANKEAAADLGLSAKTIEAHRRSIMQKLKLKSFSEMVRYAIREQIIEP
jgi:DNA-binding NarL/FixJ family response regulator